jgi:hypothetical protein
MSWQVKRYSALMKSFHREADDKIIEGACCSPATEEKVLRFFFFSTPSDQWRSSIYYCATRSQSRTTHPS